jgi:hypothetical protein
MTQCDRRALQPETHARGNDCILRFSMDRRAAVAVLGAVAEAGAISNFMYV